MIDLSKVLEYSPYDNKCPSPFGFRISQEKEEDLFYDKMFVEYPHESSKLENKLVSAIEDENIHTIVFSGASGSGKTTFLKNFFRNREDSFSCQFFNFIEKPSVIDSDNCFRTSVLNAIGGVLSKNVASIFYKSYLEQWCNIKNHHFLFLDNNLMSFLSLCNLFSQNDSELVLIKEIETFSFNTLQLISLYIISSVIAHKDDPRFLVFVFDNIDEMDRQYLNNSLKDMIVSAFSVAQDYCENVLRFDFIKKTTVLISFRTENDSFLIGNTVNERYLLLHFQKIDFSHEYQAAYNEILAARIQCYLRANGKEVDLKEKHDEIRALIESEHFFFEQSIKPLYSYDYRMLTHYVIKEALCNRKVYIPDALKQSQGKTKYAQVGSRGMLLFYALAGMLRDGNSCFSTYVKEDFSDTGCNVYRMSFTLLSNICGWSHQKGGLYEGVIDYNEKTCLVHLSTFIERITPWCSDRHDDAVNKLLKLGLTACSFERPIALLGDEIDRYNNELKENYSMSTFAPNATHNHLKDLSALSTVSIQVNPLCFVYAARVFIHYEYFNLISTQWHNKENSKRGMLYDSKPLFQLSSSEQDMKNIELCLDYTFQTAKHIIISADNHFCAGCNKRNNGQQCQSDCRSFVNKFIDDGLSFNNTLDATRIIENHIHYLESYRRFLWFQNANIEHTEVDVQIQRIIINQILKYISFYRQRKIMDREYHRISNDWGIQYKNALAILDNHPQEFTEIDGGL